MPAYHQALDRPAQPVSLPIGKAGLGTTAHKGLQRVFEGGPAPLRGGGATFI